MSIENDYLSSEAASKGLAKKVQNWWAKRGYMINVRVVKEKFAGHDLWVLRMPEYIPSTDSKKGVI
jgi:hypothetical protein